MNRFEKMRVLCEELKAIAVNHNIAILFDYQQRPIRRAETTNNRGPIFIDHLTMLRMPKDGSGE